MDKALVTFVGAGLSTIVIGLGRKVPVGAIANGQYLVDHLLVTNPVETRQLIEGVVREIFVDWRASGVPIAIADAHLAALPAVLDQHRVAQNILVGGLAVAKKSEKEGRRAVTVPARRIAAEFVTLAREAQTLNRSKLSDSITFFLTERMFAQLLLERRSLIGFTTSMNTYFMKSMWMGADAAHARGMAQAEDQPEATTGPSAPAHSPSAATTLAGPNAFGGRTRPSGFGSEEGSRSVMYKPIALPQRERPLLAANLAPKSIEPFAPEFASPIQAADKDMLPPLPMPHAAAMEPLPSLDALEAELEPMFLERRAGEAEPLDGYRPDTFELDTFEPDTFEPDASAPTDEVPPGPMRESDVGPLASEADAVDADVPAVASSFDVPAPITAPTAPLAPMRDGWNAIDREPDVPDTEAAAFEPAERPPALAAQVVTSDVASHGLSRPLGPTRLRRIRKIMIAPAAIDPLDLPLPGLDELIEAAEQGPSVEQRLVPEGARSRQTSDSAPPLEPMLERMIADEEPSTVDGSNLGSTLTQTTERVETMRPVDAREAIALVPLAVPGEDTGPAPSAPHPLESRPSMVDRPAEAPSAPAMARPAEAPSAMAMMIMRTSNGEVTAATVAALEHALRANLAAPNVEPERLKTSSKLMIEVMQRLQARIVDADAGADAATAALAALRSGDFAEARRRLADAEIAVRADADAGGDLEKSAMRSVVDLRLLLTDIETACHDRPAAAEHLEVAVASVPVEEKMRRWSLAIRFARMLFRMSTGADATRPDMAALDRMIGAYRMALGTIVELNAPQDYARAEVELATLLNRRAKMSGDIGPLNEVAGFIDHTIETLARARAMDDWAEAHTQRGITYAQFATVEVLADHFETAVRSFDSALGHVSVQRSPLVWAEARIWFGLLLKQWGRRTSQPNRLAEGITHLRAVCDADSIDLTRTGFTLAELALELADAIGMLAMARNEPGLHTTAISVLSRTIARTSGVRDDRAEADLYDKLGESLWQFGAFREDADMLAKAGQAIDRAIELFIASGDDAKAEARITDLERLHDFRTDLIETRVTRQVRTPRIA